VRPKRIEDVPSRPLPDGESMVLTPQGERALVLNPVATAVWHLADGTRTLDHVARFVAEHFSDVSAAQVSSDVARLVEELIEAGVLQDADL
jgi:hypothetical protein